MLVHVPDILTPVELSQLRESLARAEWADGRGTVGAQGAQVKRNRQLSDASPLRHELGQQVLAALSRNATYFAAALPLRTFPPRFNAYEGCGHYGFHVDGAVLALPSVDGAAPKSLRTDISCTLFLSEPDDYDGGELVISDTYGEHEVKLPAGDLILYPSSSLHEVRPVTRGLRLASFFWVQSLVRDGTQRRLLLDLDTAIQRLTEASAPRDELLRLTGVYHNLLRRWSDT